jgi:hypothetical protein
MTGDEGVVIPEKTIAASHDDKTHFSMPLMASSRFVHASLTSRTRMTSFMADRRERFGTSLMALLQLFLLPVQVNTSRVSHGLCTQLKGHESGLF